MHNYQGLNKTKHNNLITSQIIDTEQDKYKKKSVTKYHRKKNTALLVQTQKLRYFPRDGTEKVSRPDFPDLD